MHIKTANGKKKIVMSRKEWESIGKKAGWIDINRPSGTGYGWEGERSPNTEVQKEIDKAGARLASLAANIDVQVNSKGKSEADQMKTMEYMRKAIPEIMENSPFDDLRAAANVTKYAYFLLEALRNVVDNPRIYEGARKLAQEILDEV